MALFPLTQYDFPNVSNYDGDLRELLEYVRNLSKAYNVIVNRLPALEQQFAELQTFVNSYFEHLNVQDEINNKLNAMLENGELGELISKYAGLNQYSPINFSHMFAGTPNWANGIGNVNFIGPHVQLSESLGWTCTATKNTYALYNGKTYYLYFTINTNDINASEEAPSKIKIEILHHDDGTVYHEFNFNVTHTGVSTYDCNFIFNGGSQDIEEDPRAFVYKIRISYDAVITTQFSPTLQLANLRLSVDAPSSGQLQPLLPIIKNTVPHYNPNYEMSNDSYIRYYNGILAFNAKFTCVRASVALVQLPTLQEAFITDELNQHTRVKYINLTSGTNGYLRMYNNAGYPWLWFETAETPAVDDEIIVCDAVPWRTQPDMYLYDIEM